MLERLVLQFLDQRAQSGVGPELDRVARRVVGDGGPTRLVVVETVGAEGRLAEAARQRLRHTRAGSVIVGVRDRIRVRFKVKLGLGLGLGLG